MLSLEQLEQDAIGGKSSVFRFCAQVAELFGLRTHEVAVLKLQDSMLQFIYPPELRSSGSIPLISSSQAARTASTKRAEIFNKFSSVRHSSIFETIKLSGNDPLTIQKLMSVPVFTPEGDVYGVMQVSRKAASPEKAGADFSSADLQRLQQVAKIFGEVVKNLQDESGFAANSAQADKSSSVQGAIA